jgi:8-oxo-dGTP diphosphatase
MCASSANGKETMTASHLKIRKIAAAIVIDTTARLLLQQRDDIPNILYPGRIALFGGHLENDETFQDGVVREVHEEISYYIPPEQFEHVTSLVGPDPEVRGCPLHAEFFVTREVRTERVKVTEGSLKIATVNELAEIKDRLTPLAHFALQFFFGHDVLP